MFKNSYKVFLNFIKIVLYMIFKDSYKKKKMFFKYKAGNGHYLPKYLFNKFFREMNLKFGCFNLHL